VIPEVLLPAATGFAVSVVATGAVNVVARRRGLLDRPDPSRRTHAVPTPRLGGVGIALGALAGVVCLVVTARARDLASDAFLALGAGAGGFFAVGLLDDLAPRGVGLAARVKLLLLAAVATLAVMLGARFDGTAAGSWPALDLGPSTAPLTVLWFLAVANVVNFMDGIDAITATTAAVILAAAAGSGGACEPVEAAAAGAVVGFLVWNAPEAKIFMGDGGAYLLGFLVAASPCRFGDSGTPAGAPWPLVGAALVPSIVDVVEALIHKRRAGIPLSQPHHDHLYQRLVKAGHPPALVALRYGALALAAIAVAGPVADRLGALPATAIGLAVLAAHLALGRRSTRAVPRLEAS